MGFQDVGIFPGMKFLKIEFFCGKSISPGRYPFSGCRNQLLLEFSNCGFSLKEFLEIGISRNWIHSHGILGISLSV